MQNQLNNITPLDPYSGSIDTTYKLCITSRPKIYKFCLTVKSYLIILTATIPGIFILSYFLLQQDYKNAFFGFFCLFVGGLLFYAMRKNRTFFDIDSKLFYAKDIVWGKKREVISFNKINAFQILEKTVHSSSSRRMNSFFKSYELNIILKNGRRLNVVDHGNYEIIKENAYQLSIAIGKPIYNLVQSNSVIT